MQHVHVQYGHKSGLSALGNSLGGACIGVLLFLVAFPLLWWNEGTAVQTARSLDEGLALVVAVDADHVDRANQGRLVHVSGQLSRVPLLVDEDLGVAEPGLRLERVVEMYQWHEKERTERHKDAYGNEHSRTTYTYTEQWSSTPIDSSRFAHGGYNNPANWPYISKLVGARSAALGAFQLREQELGQLPADQRVDLSPSSLEHMAGLIEDSEGEGPVRVLRLEAGQGHKHHRQHKLLDGPSGDGKDAKIQRHKKHSNALSRAAEEEGESNGPSTALVAVNAGFEVSGGRLYSTGALRRPRVGDLRIAYKVSNPATVSVVAQQRGNRFAPFQTRSGDALLMVEEGELDEHTMFAKMRTWAFRGVGMLLMFVGILLLLSPLSQALSLVPCIGPLLAGIVDVGICAAATLVAIPCALITIASAWVWYRPVAAAVIFGVALIFFFGLHRQVRVRKRE